MATISWIPILNINLNLPFFGNQRFFRITNTHKGGWEIKPVIFKPVDIVKEF